MSIATRIENMNDNLKNAYDSLEDLGVDLENINKNLQNLSIKIDTLYDELPKVTGEGTEITLTPTRKGRMQLDLKGNTSQESTSIDGGDEYDSPSPDHPQPIHVVTGNNSVGVQGKNLFDGLISGYLGSDGNIIKPRNGYCISDFIIVEPNTQYTLSGLENDAGNGYKHIIEFDENEQFLNRIYVGGAKTEKKSFTTTATTKYIVYGIFSQFSSEQEAKNYRDNQKIQLEQNSTATSYVPYYHADYPVNLGLIELCKIGDYQDYLYKENGNWYKYGVISYNVATGASSEEWEWVVRNENKIMVQSRNIGACIDGRTFTAIYSKYYRGTAGNTIFDASNTTVNIIGCAERSGIRIAVSPNDFANVDDFKNFLQENNLDFYFVLATPSIIQITDTTLISQLDAIEKAKSDEDQTNITQTNADLPFIINATALLKNDEY